MFELFLIITIISFFLFLIVAKYHTGQSWQMLYKAYACAFIKTLVFSSLLFFIILYRPITFLYLIPILLAVSSCSILLKHIHFKIIQFPLVFDMWIVLLNMYCIIVFVMDKPTTTPIFFIYSILLIELLYEQVQKLKQ